MLNKRSIVTHAHAHHTFTQFHTGHAHRLVMAPNSPLVALVSLSGDAAVTNTHIYINSLTHLHRHIIT